MAAPLQRVAPIPWAPSGPLPDALLFTSAQAPSLVAHHPALRGVAVWAVGRSTAAAAHRAGFRVVFVGSQDASATALAAAAAGIRNLWHIGGRDRAPMTVPADVVVTPHAVYAAELAEALPARVIGALEQGRVLATLLFSARAAGCFGTLVDAAGVQRSMLRLVALSQAVAAAAGDGWARIVIAERPTACDCFAAASQLWQEWPHDRP